VTIAYGALVLAGVCALVRTLRGPTLADRVVALDVALISLMSAIAVAAAARGSDVALTLPVVIAIIGFTATIAAGRFIERERREEPEE
jgi:multicomponent Na+:H+ antiporter subunit F